MLFDGSLEVITDYILFVVCIFILLGSVFITCQMRFVQVRCFPQLYRMLKSSFARRHTAKNAHTILPHQALFTSMSTTLGISTIVAPVIAIKLGGPGALIGFLLTAFFGSAATFTEVNLSLQYRKRLSCGTIMGGPMQYLYHLVSPRMAKWYALGCFVLMAVWSAAQANQLAAILDSPLLGTMRMPTYLSGILIALCVIFTLTGGIKRVSALSSRLVSAMFILYLSACMWILVNNYDLILPVLGQVFHAAISPYALASGTLVGGAVSALRWGIFKGIQTCEAGLGTQSIPHSMAEIQNDTEQGLLAMLSTYTSGALAFLSGCVALITQTWLDPNIPLGINMVAASFEIYFAYAGIIIIAICALLFAFGTILGNSYNGSQCFGYLTQNKYINIYLIASAFVIFCGAIAEVKIVWSLVDVVLAAIAIPHMCALIVYAYRNPIAKQTLAPVPIPVDNYTPMQ